VSEWACSGWFGLDWNEVQMLTKIVVRFARIEIIDGPIPSAPFTTQPGMEPHPQPYGTNLRASETRTTRGSSSGGSSSPRRLLLQQPRAPRTPSRHRQVAAGNHRCLLPGASQPQEVKPPPRSPEPKKFDVKDGQQVSRVASSAPRSPSLSASAPTSSSSRTRHSIASLSRPPSSFHHWVSTVLVLPLSWQICFGRAGVA
jgi:hypothetical protein